MPSKYTTGNSPIGRRIRNKNSPVSGFAQVEREIGRVQSVPSLVSRSRQLPNGTLHLPPKAQAGGESVCNAWRLSVSKDAVSGIWAYSVKLGLLNDMRSSAFDTETDTYQEDIEVVGDVQVGLKVALKAPVNASGYVMPGSDPTFEDGPDNLTFVAE